MNMKMTMNRLFSQIVAFFRIQSELKLEPLLIQVALELKDHGITGIDRFHSNEDLSFMQKFTRTTFIFNFSRIIKKVTIFFSGTYEYKFIIQNQWVHDPSIPNIRN